MTPHHLSASLSQTAGAAAVFLAPDSDLFAERHHVRGFGPSLKPIWNLRHPPFQKAGFRERVGSRPRDDFAGIVNQHLAIG